MHACELKGINMGASMNIVALVGRLARTPELSKTTTGKSVCRFTVAADRPMAKKEDSQQQTADFVPCIAWNKTAENLYQYCHKGSLVGVEGSIHTGSYTNKQGQKVYTTDILCDRVTFLETKTADQNRQTAQTPADPYAGQKSVSRDDISRTIAQDPADPINNTQQSAKQMGADDMLWGHEPSQQAPDLDISADDLPF